ncbi:MAG TPA: hypothetical protein VK835_08915 [Bacteroidia bacterium]|jgi:hypothetical protein|nr:hypothetical protein [Bacteroidia bacterium]
MKKIFITTLSIAAISGTCVLTSCGGGNKADTDAMASDSTKVDTTAAVKPSNTSSTEMTYQIPSPKEMFVFIKQVAGKNNKRTDVLNSPDKVKNYADAKSQALNFGIYSCDLTYCSIFEIGTDVLKYFKTVKQLGDAVGVSSSISPSMLKSLEKNMGNPDSLVEIADNLYFSSFESMQNSQQGTTLALSVAGGYIEGLNIACGLVKYDKKNPAIERIADEKYTLDNIIDFMKKYESDAGVKETIAQLEDLRTTFNQVTEKEEGAVAVKEEKGVKVLGGGSQSQITEAQYKALTDKVASIRNSFTGK